MGRSAVAEKMDEGKRRRDMLFVVIAAVVELETVGRCVEGGGGGAKKDGKKWVWI